MNLQDIKDGIVHRMTKLNSAASPGDEVLKWTNNESITVVNLEGRYVLPGLIDCHVHLSTPPGEEGLGATMNVHHDTSLLRQTYLANEILKRGFTTVRDCGGAGLAIKEALAEGLVAGPRLFIAGHGISQTGGHGDLRNAKDAEYSCCGGNTKGLGRIADGVDQCLHAAREELRQGADFIKIMVSGGVVSPTDALVNLQYTPEVKSPLFHSTVFLANSWSRKFGLSRRSPAIQERMSPLTHTPQPLFEMPLRTASWELSMVI